MLTEPYDPMLHAPYLNGDDGPLYRNFSMATGLEGAIHLHHLLWQMAPQTMGRN